MVEIIPAHGIVVGDVLLAPMPLKVVRITEDVAFPSHVKYVRFQCTPEGAAATNAYGNGAYFYGVLRHNLVMRVAP